MGVLVEVRVPGLIRLDAGWVGVGGLVEVEVAV